MTTTEQMKLAIHSFLGNDGIQYLKEYDNKGKFLVAWGSFLGGCVGMQVRNFLTSKYPDVVENVGTYQDFEDLTYKLAIEIMNEN